ncbi:MAG TPA: recombinase family protein [Isosphaeraceae bacterium]|nr:recombinase family protein [Isosphaeraceae bacterium]
MPGRRSAAARPALAQAIAHAQRTNARLVIARLDRLSRNAAFLLNLMESKVRFVACDMPEADETMVGVLWRRWRSARPS